MSSRLVLSPVRRSSRMTFWATAEDQLLSKGRNYMLVEDIARQESNGVDDPRSMQNFTQRNTSP